MIKLINKTHERKQKMKKNIILDFDGTLTNTSVEAVPFLENSKKYFCESLGIFNSDEFEQIYQEIKNRKLSDPNVGWDYGGQVIAPAADPYSINNVVMAEILKDLNKGTLEHRIKCDADKLLTVKKDELITEIFMKSYDPTSVCFRESQSLTKNFLKDLLFDSNVAIITNSGTSAVKQKLDILKLPVAVYGYAKKYENDPEATEINPAELNLNGFPRPVLLRRKRYYDLLQNLDSEFGYAPENTVVIGDFYELDLALPEQMGYGVIQIQTPFTPAYEAAYHNENKSSYYVENYDETIVAINALL
jgi:FMN phosphatase YigB (HAD superfamily)